MYDLKHHQLQAIPIYSHSFEMIFNAETWSLLSEDSQAVLLTLLPPTAFSGYQQSIDASHPRKDASSPLLLLSGTLDPSVFTDAHFLFAMHTFQDHIFSGWASDIHTAKVEKSKQGICNGTLSALYKDKGWDNQNRNDAQWLTLPKSSAHAGLATEVKLMDLVHNVIIQVKDLILYKQNFMNGNIVIKKDAHHLPAVLLGHVPGNPDDSIWSITITSLSMLETALLDIDGWIEQGKRPNGNAWKSFTLWQWKDSNEELISLNERGGRESHGTLFYIRGCFYYDQ
ncbi:hypothetical protein ARMGADRAFT_1137454 [Armillaria gallica]|uniref:ASX DEUBAD domain-containing protein n=1 Tax=Armillaria gallica TaxID=47427 RepID=A0A2H3D4I7_ARMGA|nr:hypothetical protein ARMGADRAFT_1137454 [Armillaria gallica]